MPFRLPTQLSSRLFTTSSKTRTAIPSSFHTYNQPQLALRTPSVPKLGRIGRWYLPTMVAIAAGMLYLPSSPLASPVQTDSPSSTESLPSQQRITLDSANRRIGFAITNALEQHNRAPFPSISPNALELTQQERNRMLMEAYGQRESLEDMERAFRAMGEERAPLDPRERNRRLLDAYGDKASLKDLQKAMEIYEVQ